MRTRISESTFPVDTPVLNNIWQERTNRAWSGFYVHKACIHLLEKRVPLSSNPENVSRLRDIVESLPIQRFGRFWPHQFGGILVPEVEDAFPWQEMTSRISSREGDPVWIHDPLNFRGLEIFSQYKDIARKDRAMIGESARNVGKDIFSALPWELRERIAFYLPTPDALSLRRASTSFYPLLESNSFCAARFLCADSDDFRSSIFEARDLRKRRHGGAVDWCRLFRQTRPERYHGTPGWRNRFRIWRKVVALEKIIVRSRFGGGSWGVEDMPEGTVEMVAGSRQVPCAITSHLRAVSSTDWKKPEYTPLRIGVKVPTGLCGIGVSVVRFGAATYVSGFRFISDEEGIDDVLAGWVCNDDEVLVYVRRESFRGFKVAVTLTGLRAVQIVDAIDGLSRWIGDPSEVPRSDKLVCMEDIESVSLQVDAFKVIEIGIKTSNDPSPDDGLSTTSSLRSTALWYPDTPPTQALLNEAFLAGLKPDIEGYQPLVTCMFGGERGNDLQKLIGIRCQVARDSLRAVEFVYLSQGEGTTFGKKLGRYKPTVSRAPLTQQNAMFEIDGAAGERISAVYALVDNDTDSRYSDNGLRDILTGIKIQTNFGRQYKSFSASAKELELISVEKGTTITGLYTHQESNYGLTTLGVMSEHL